MRKFRNPILVVVLGLIAVVALAQTFSTTEFFRLSDSNADVRRKLNQSGVTIGRLAQLQAMLFSTGTFSTSIVLGNATYTDNGSSLRRNGVAIAGGGITAEQLNTASNAVLTVATNADNLTTGTIPEARIPGAIARDDEVAVSLSLKRDVTDTNFIGGIAGPTGTFSTSIVLGGQTYTDDGTNLLRNGVTISGSVTPEAVAAALADADVSLGSMSIDGFGAGTFIQFQTVGTNIVAAPINLGTGLEVVGGALNATASAAQPVLVNVKAFGAVGDGTTDDTTAIQAAIDSITAAGSPLPTDGAKIYFPQGKYRFTDQLVIKGGTAFENPILLEGEKQTISILYYTGTTSPAIVPSATGSNSHGLQVEIRDLTLLGEGTFTGVGLSVVGDSVNNNTPSMLTRLERVLFRGWGGTAFQLNKAYGVVLRDVWFRNCDKAYAISGATPGTDFANGIRFENVSVEFCGNGTNHVGTVDWADGFSWDFGIIEGNEAGISFQHVRNGTLANLYFENNGTNTPNMDIDSCGPLVLSANIWSLGANATGLRTLRRFTSNQLFSQILIGNMFVGDPGSFPITLGTATTESFAPVLLNNYYRDATVPIRFTDVRGGDNDAASGNTPEVIDGEFKLRSSTGATIWRMNGADVNGIIALANSATPSVKNRKVFATGGTTTITHFADGVTGQIIVVMAEHSITITHGTNIFLTGSANWAMAAGDSLTLIQKADGKWYEIARSDK